MENQHTPGAQDADTPTPTPQDLPLRKFIEDRKQRGRLLDLQISEFIETSKNQFETLQAAINETKEENRRGLEENKNAIEENKAALIAHDRQCVQDKTTMQGEINDLKARVKILGWQLWAVIGSHLRRHSHLCNPGSILVRPENPA